jgi:SNF2 family DNA or RNA helicase
MAGGRHGPIAGFKNFYHFRASYGYMSGYKGKQWFPDQEKLPGLRERFKPFVLRREKADCLDLPPKTYTVREVALTSSTWKVYQELRREALLVLSEKDVRPEPHAAVRLMRLCQLTSGHVGMIQEGGILNEAAVDGTGGNCVLDVSNEKLSWLAEAILEGELAGERALIVWCRWRRERERLAHLLALKHVAVPEVYGGQAQTKRETAVKFFQESTDHRVLVAQPHAGGYGLTLTAAATAIYLSNDYSYITRVQSEDRCHRIGQLRPVTYVDVLAIGPRGERTVDHTVLKALKAKEDLAKWTCARWRRELS